MKTVIVGCGRVGAVLATSFDQAGHEVIILDLTSRAFDRLPSTFRGTALRGDGTDEDVLRRVGAEGADVFVALTEGDNRNVMSAQLAVEAFEIPSVVAKINDPVRANAYADLGIAALCRTNLMADAVYEYLGMPQSGLTGILQPTGSHPGGEHHDLAVGAPVAGAAAGGSSSDSARSGSRAAPVATAARAATAANQGGASNPATNGQPAAPAREV